MNKYSATFPNGTTITRNTMHTYTHAWAVFGPDGKIVSRFSGMKGFAGSSSKANTAAADALRRAAAYGQHVAVTEAVEVGAAQLAAGIAAHQASMKMQEELNSQVVSEVCGKPVTRGQLAAAFEKVQPAGHWKNAINAVVECPTDEDMSMIQEAVSFFTGSNATFTRVEGRKYRVRAAGYFAAVGA